MKTPSLKMMSVAVFFALVFISCRAAAEYPNSFFSSTSNIGETEYPPWEDNLCLETDSTCRSTAYFAGVLFMDQWVIDEYDNDSLNFSYIIEGEIENIFETDYWYQYATVTGIECPWQTTLFSWDADSCVPDIADYSGAFCPAGFAAYSSECYPDLTFSECEAYAAVQASTSFALITFPPVDGSNPAANFCDVNTAAEEEGGGTTFDDTGIIAALGSLEGSNDANSASELSALNDIVDAVTDDSTAVFNSTPDVYVSKYPTGIHGVFSTFKANVQNTSMYQVIGNYSFSDAGASCDPIVFNMNTGIVDFGTQQIDFHCTVFPYLKIIFILTAIFAARRIIFGG